MNESIMATDEKKLLWALGLCARARKAIFGVPMICDAMRRGGESTPKIVFEASDTSENTHKKICDKCSYYNVKLVRLTSDGLVLAGAVGKGASLAAVAISDANFCALAEQYIRTDK